MKRILVIGSVVLVLVVAAVAIFLWTGLDATIRAVVERVGSDCTQTAVNLRTVHVGLTSGEGTMETLSVANPKGFTTKNAFELGKIHVRIEPGSVMSEVVVVPEILIDAPHVTFELGAGGSNLGILKENVAKYGSTGAAEDTGRPAGADGAKPESGRRFAVHDVVIRNVRVDAAAPMLGGGAQGVTIPEVRVRDIGGAKGATSGELATAILGALTRSALDAAEKFALETVEKKGLDLVKDRALDILKKKH